MSANGAGVPTSDHSTLPGRMGTERGKEIYFDPAELGKLQGTGDLEGRIGQGASYTTPGSVNAYYYNPTAESTAALPSNLPPVADCLAFLEDIPTKERLVKDKENVMVEVLGAGDCIGTNAPGTIKHIVMSLPAAFKYKEGQSISVVPNGVDAKGKAHKARLYSIASTRYGDLADGKTVSLCVRLAEFTDPVTGETDDAKVGVCSSQLCSATPGTQFKISGPVGKTMLLPEDPSKDIIMVATGTGVAPFRAFCHRLFMEATPAAHTFTGKAWMFLGVPVTDGLLYPDEFAAMEENAKVTHTHSAHLEAHKLATDTSHTQGQLKLTYAISREQKNAQGGRMYVQDQLAANGDEIFNRIEKGGSIYFCGLKGMMPGILEALEAVAVKRGMNFEDKIEEWKETHRWHVEVY